MSKVTERKHKCPPHYFLINSENIGHCKYCPEVRNFLELLRRNGVFVKAGRRGAKKEGMGRKRGRKKKEVLL